MRRFQTLLSRPFALWAATLLLAIVLAVAYSNTFRVPWLMDDTVTIQQNPSIRHLSALDKVLSPPTSVFSRGRPILNLTFAINYAIGADAVASYHLANLCIHLGSALLLFGLVRRVLSQHPRSDPDATALIAAAIWALHPVNTDAVTYVSQRAESLMGLFYIGTFYCWVRGTTGRQMWYAGAILCCALGMATKEVMLTAPVLLLMFDRTFLAGTWTEVWRRRGPWFLGITSTWCILAGLMASAHVTSFVIGPEHAYSPWSYLLVEGKALLHYVQLALWPAPLVFDYGPMIAVGSEVHAILRLLLLAAVFAWFLLQWWRGSALAWCGLAWFVLLAPTSSVVPIAAQPMAESRLYLALIPGVVGGIVALRWCLPRYTLLAGLVVVVAFLAITVRRNADYTNAEGLWRDTIAKRPDNMRAYNTVAALVSRVPGRELAAAQIYEHVLSHEPLNDEAHNGLGFLLSKQPGREPEAIAHLQAALRGRPDFADALTNLGTVLARVAGQQAAAERCFRAAIQAKPNHAEAENDLANLLAAENGRDDDAEEMYRAALRDKPELSEAHSNLALVLARRRGNEPAAIAEATEAVRMDPGSAEAHNTLGLLLIRAPGRVSEGEQQLRLAIQLKPDLADAHNNLGTALGSERGRELDALSEFETARRLNPTDASVCFNAGLVLSRMGGRANDAIQYLRVALQLQPDMTPARSLLRRLQSKETGNP